jgi:hypothetical protein
MRPSKTRRFHVGDAMILVAATAAGIVGTRHVWDRASYNWFWYLGQGWTVRAINQQILTVVALSLPSLAAWTAAVLVLRLRAPRPTLRRLVLQPGAAACLVALLVITLETIGEAAAMAYFEYSKGYLGAEMKTSGLAGWLHVRVLMRTPYPVSYAILAAWAILALSRRGRPERSWIDRAGRALGICWIVFALIFWLNQHFFYGQIPGALTIRWAASVGLALWTVGAPLG